METTKKTSSIKFEGFHSVPSDFTGAWVMTSLSYDHLTRTSEIDGYVYNVYKNGEPHSTVEPSYIWYSLDGTIREEWYCEGHCHRLDGPAAEDNREGYLSEYHIHGSQYTEEAFWQHPKVILYNSLKKVDRIINEVF